MESACVPAVDDFFTLWVTVALEINTCTVDNFGKIGYKLIFYSLKISLRSKSKVNQNRNQQNSCNFIKFSMMEQVFFGLSITCTRQNCNFFNLVKIWQPILCWFICFKFVNLTLFCQFCKSNQNKNNWLIEETMDLSCIRSANKKQMSEILSIVKLFIKIKRFSSAVHILHAFWMSLTNMERISNTVLPAR